jgi:Concanavalin A-like lectin/glucanases superfamily/BNR repeat-containing family member
MTPPFVVRLLSTLLLASLYFTASAQTNFATLAPDGGWTWYNDPRALYHNGILYFGYVRSDGKTALSAFDPTNGASTLLFTSSWSEKDDHNNPGLLSMEDGRLLAIYAHHSSTHDFNYRTSLSTNPVSASDWGAEQSFTTAAGVTYSNPYRLSNEPGVIYNFLRDLNFNPTVTTSTNGATNWNTPKILIQTGTGSTRPYVKYSSDYSNRIDFLYTDGHPRDVTNSLYHMFYSNGALHYTDGSILKSFDSIPLLHDSGERGTVIYQYSNSPTNDPNDHIPTGRAWCWETAYQTNGNPVCVFTVQRDFVTGTNWFDDRIYYYYARWTGTNWQKRFIAHAGRPLFNPEDDYAGGICIDPEHPDIICISSNAQNPFNLSDTTNVPLNANQRYELYRGVTSDGGLTFTWTAVTTNSPQDNLRPYFPRNQAGWPTLIWFRGTYTTFNNYHTEVVGFFLNPVPIPPSVTIANPTVQVVALTNLNNKLILNASAMDDGLPAPLSISWDTVSGPTNAIFSDPTSTNTAASFPLPGSYILQVTASDTLSSSSAQVTVNAGANITDNPDPSRALWLKLNEASGLIASDSSGNGYNGSLSGGATWQPTNGIRNGALKFDGISGVVTIPDTDDLDNTSAFTLAYWFRADAYPADSAGLVCKRDGTTVNNAYTTYLKTADKHIYIDIDSSNNRFASSAIINTGAWYHVALVFDGSLPSSERVSLYINGTLDTTTAESSTVIPNYGSALRLGNTHAGAANWFNGLIDDVRFHRRALTTAEIQALAQTHTAPSVQIGAVPPITNGISAPLFGSVTVDGTAGPTTVQWTKITGPGNASFTNPQSPSTDVTVDLSGNYTLRLAATDSQLTIASDIILTAQPNTNLFEDWISQYYPGTTDPAVIGITADPDSDGAKNLLEFALGMNPTIGDATHFIINQPGLPVGFLLNFGGTNYLALQVKRPVNRPNITYSAETSSDLLTWDPALVIGPPVFNGDGTETMLFRDLIPVSQSNARYMRLKITRP